MLPSNPVEKVRPPRQEPHEATALQPEELRALLAHAAGTRVLPVLDFTWRSALRLGEALALRWEDVDLSAGALTVRRNLGRAGGGTLTAPRPRRNLEQAPKTPRGTRTFILPKGAVALLKSHKAKQAEERLALGDAWQEGGHIFTGRHGQPMDRRWVQEAFTKARERAGLPEGVSFHSLRHTFATLGKTAGVDILELSRALGHHSPAFTAATYQHVTTDSQRTAAERFDKLARVADSAQCRKSPRSPCSAFLSSGPDSKSDG